MNYVLLNTVKDYDSCKQILEDFASDKCIKKKTILTSAIKSTKIN